MKIKNHNKILLHTQLEWLKSKRLATQKVLVKIWANCNSPTSLENSLAVSYKVKYTDNISTILLPGIFPRDEGVCAQKYWYVHISFIHNSTNWKQPKHPSADEHINKLSCIYTVLYYLEIKCIKLLIFKNMNLTDIILSRKCLRQKIYDFICMSF